MLSSRGVNKLTIALYANVALLAAILLALLTHNGGSRVDLSSSAFGQTQLPIAGGAGLFVMPAQFSTNTWGCYVMDVDAQTLCAYQFIPSDKELRFIAARSFKYDRRLSNYNTTPPPLEIKGLIDKETSASVGPKNTEIEKK